MCDCCRGITIKEGRERVKSILVLYSSSSGKERINCLARESRSTLHPKQLCCRILETTYPLTGQRAGGTNRAKNKQKAEEITLFCLPWDFIDFEEKKIFQSNEKESQVSHFLISSVYNSLIMVHSWAWEYFCC